MTKITTFDLSPWYRNSVGIDRLFDRITTQLDTAANNNYPPYDIIKTSDNLYEIRIAAAGFTQAEIDIEHHDGRLLVTAARGEKARPEVEYLHHGISNRSWIRSWTLADYVEVKDAVMKDGILSIRLEHVVPEAMKPKKIVIAYDTQ